MHNSDIITTLKERRDTLRITQETLAATAGVSLRTLKQFESGKGNPTLETLQKLASVMGMELVLRVKATEVTT